MGEKKYSLKIESDFFNQSVISCILSQEKGFEYIVIYQKLCLKSLKNNGKVIINTRIPLMLEELAKEVRFPVNLLRNALDVLEYFELIEILEDGTIYICNIENLIIKE